MRCSSTWGVCGEPGGHKRAIGSSSQICIGFESSSEGGGAAQKAVFKVNVDTYSRLRVVALWPLIASGNWSDIDPYRFMWLASEGHRTVGQTAGVVTGVIDNNNVNCSYVEGVVPRPASECKDAAVGCTCYGWVNQSKPVLSIAGWRLITGLTAIIHMKMGEVTHIMWDSQCNLCQGRNDGSLACFDDSTRSVCKDGWGGAGSEGPCKDCYFNLDPATCKDEACAPTVYVAWEGTDANGQPLLSAGAIISRFQQYSLDGLYDELRDEVLQVPS